MSTNQEGRKNCCGLPQYHLRRIGPPATKPGVADVMDFHGIITLIGRNAQRVDYLLDSSSENTRLYISRVHARVVIQADGTGSQQTILQETNASINNHRLHDDSLNGVFINNIKIAGSVVLREGDRVTFGHPQGEKKAPGTRIRQPDSEYQFMFERCNCPSVTLSHHDDDDKKLFAVPKPAGSNSKSKRDRNATRTFTQTDCQNLKMEYEGKVKMDSDDQGVEDKAGTCKSNQAPTLDGSSTRTTSADVGTDTSTADQVKLKDASDSVVKMDISSGCDKNENSSEISSSSCVHKNKLALTNRVSPKKDTGVQTLDEDLVVVEKTSPHKDADIQTCSYASVAKDEPLHGNFSHHSGILQAEGGNSSHQSGTTQHEGGNSPHQSGTTQHEGGNSPHQSGTTQHEGGNSPHQSGTTQHEGGNSPHQSGTTQPEGGNSSHQSETTQPEGGNSSHQSGTTQHEGGNSPHQSGTTQPEGGNSSHHSGITQHEGWNSPHHGETTQPEGGNSPYDSETLQAEGGKSLHQSGMLQPEGGNSPHQSGTTQPEGGNSLHQSGTTQHEGWNSPHQSETTQPEGGNSTHHSGTLRAEGKKSPPYNGTTQPEGGNSSHQNETTQHEGWNSSHQNETTQPEGGNSSHQSETTHPEGGNSPHHTGSLQPECENSPHHTGSLQPECENSPHHTGSLQPECENSPHHTGSLQPECENSPHHTGSLQPECENSPHHIGSLQPECENSAHHIGSLQPECENSAHHIGSLQPECENSAHHIGSLQPECENSPHHIGSLQPECENSPHHIGSLQPECENSAHDIGTLQPEGGNSSHHSGRLQSESLVLVSKCSYENGIPATNEYGDGTGSDFAAVEENLSDRVDENDGSSLPAQQMELEVQSYAESKNNDMQTERTSVQKQESIQASSQSEENDISGQLNLELTKIQDVGEMLHDCVNENDEAIGKNNDKAVNNLDNVTTAYEEDQLDSGRQSTEKVLDLKCNMESSCDALKNNCSGVVSDNEVVMEQNVNQEMAVDMVGLCKDLIEDKTCENMETDVAKDRNDIDSDTTDDGCVTDKLKGGAVKGLSSENGEISEELMNEAYDTFLANEEFDRAFRSKKSDKVLDRQIAEQVYDKDGNNPVDLEMEEADDTSKTEDESKSQKDGIGLVYSNSIEYFEEEDQNDSSDGDNLSDADSELLLEPNNNQYIETGYESDVDIDNKMKCHELFCEEKIELQSEDSTDKEVNGAEYPETEIVANDKKEKQNDEVVSSTDVNAGSDKTVFDKQFSAEDLQGEPNELVTRKMNDGSDDTMDDSVTPSNDLSKKNANSLGEGDKVNRCDRDSYANLLNTDTAVNKGPGKPDSRGSDKCQPNGDNINKEYGETKSCELNLNLPNELGSTLPNTNSSKVAVLGEASYLPNNGSNESDSSEPNPCLPRKEGAHKHNEQDPQEAITSPPSKECGQQNIFDRLSDKIEKDNGHLENAIIVKSDLSVNNLEQDEQDKEIDTERVVKFGSHKEDGIVGKEPGNVGTSAVKVNKESKLNEKGSQEDNELDNKGHGLNTKQQADNIICVVQDLRDSHNGSDDSTDGQMMTEKVDCALGKCKNGDRAEIGFGTGTVVLGVAEKCDLSLQTRDIDCTHKSVDSDMYSHGLAKTDKIVKNIENITGKVADTRISVMADDMDSVASADADKHLANDIALKGNRIITEPVLKPLEACPNNTEENNMESKSVSEDFKEELCETSAAVKTTVAEQCVVSLVVTGKDELVKNTVESQLQKSEEKHCVNKSNLHHLTASQQSLDKNNLQNMTDHIEIYPDNLSPISKNIAVLQDFVKTRESTPKGTLDGKLLTDSDTNVPEFISPASKKKRDKEHIDEMMQCLEDSISSAGEETFDNSERIDSSSAEQRTPDFPLMFVQDAVHQSINSPFRKPDKIVFSMNKNENGKCEDLNRLVEKEDIHRVQSINFNVALSSTPNKQSHQDKLQNWDKMLDVNGGDKFFASDEEKNNIVIKSVWSRDETNHKPAGTSSIDTIDRDDTETSVDIKANDQNGAFGSLSIDVEDQDVTGILVKSKDEVLDDHQNDMDQDLTETSLISGDGLKDKSFQEITVSLSEDLMDQNNLEVTVTSENKVLGSNQEDKSLSLSDDNMDQDATDNVSNLSSDDVRSIEQQDMTASFSYDVTNYQDASASSDNSDDNSGHEDTRTVLSEDIFDEGISKSSAKAQDCLKGDNFELTRTLNSDDFIEKDTSIVQSDDAVNCDNEKIQTTLDGNIIGQNGMQVGSYDDAQNMNSEFESSIPDNAVAEDGTETSLLPVDDITGNINQNEMIRTLYPDYNSGQNAPESVKHDGNFETIQELPCDVISIKDLVKSSDCSVGNRSDHSQDKMSGTSLPDVNDQEASDTLKCASKDNESDSQGVTESFDNTVVDLDNGYNEREGRMSHLCVVNAEATDLVKCNAPENITGTSTSEASLHLGGNLNNVSSQHEISSHTDDSSKHTKRPLIYLASNADEDKYQCEKNKSLLSSDDLDIQNFSVYSNDANIDDGGQQEVTQTLFPDKNSTAIVTYSSVSEVVNDKTISENSVQNSFNSSKVGAEERSGDGLLSGIGSGTDNVNELPVEMASPAFNKIQMSNLPTEEVAMEEDDDDDEVTLPSLSECSAQAQEERDKLSAKVVILPHQEKPGESHKEMNELSQASVLSSIGDQVEQHNDTENIYEDQPNIQEISLGNKSPDKLPDTSDKKMEHGDSVGYDRVLSKELTQEEKTNVGLTVTNNNVSVLKVSANVTNIVTNITNKDQPSSDELVMDGEKTYCSQAEHVETCAQPIDSLIQLEYAVNTWETNDYVEVKSLSDTTCVVKEKHSGEETELGKTCVLSSDNSDTQEEVTCEDSMLRSIVDPEKVIVEEVKNEMERESGPNASSTQPNDAISINENYASKDMGEKDLQQKDEGIMSRLKLTNVTTDNANISFGEVDKVTLSQAVEVGSSPFTRLASKMQEGNSRPENIEIVVIPSGRLNCSELIDKPKVKEHVIDIVKDHNGNGNIYGMNETELKIVSVCSGRDYDKLLSDHVMLEVKGQLKHSTVDKADSLQDETDGESCLTKRNTSLCSAILPMSGCVQTDDAKRQKLFHQIADDSEEMCLPSQNENLMLIETRDMKSASQSCEGLNSEMIVEKDRELTKDTVKQDVFKSLTQSSTSSGSQGSDLLYTLDIDTTKLEGRSCDSSCGNFTQNSSLSMDSGSDFFSASNSNIVLQPRKRKRRDSEDIAETGEAKKPKLRWAQDARTILSNFFQIRQIVENQKNAFDKQTLHKNLIGKIVTRFFSLRKQNALVLPSSETVEKCDVSVCDIQVCNPLNSIDSLNGEGSEIQSSHKVPKSIDENICDNSSEACHWNSHLGNVAELAKCAKCLKTYCDTDKMDNVVSECVEQRQQPAMLSADFTESVKQISVKVESSAFCVADRITTLPSDSNTNVDHIEDSLNSKELTDQSKPDQNMDMQSSRNADFNIDMLSNRNAELNSNMLIFEQSQSGDDKLVNRVSGVDEECDQNLQTMSADKEKFDGGLEEEVNVEIPDHAVNDSCLVYSDSDGDSYHCMEETRKYCANADERIGDSDIDIESEIVHSQNRNKCDLMDRNSDKLSENSDSLKDISEKCEKIYIAEEYAENVLEIIYSQDGDSEKSLKKEITLGCRQGADQDVTESHDCSVGNEDLDHFSVATLSSEGSGDNSDKSLSQDLLVLREDDARCSDDNDEFSEKIEKDEFCKRKSDHMISSEENQMLSSNEGHTISSEENHMLSSNEGHMISSEENHMLSSNEGHTISSEENHMLSSNEGHTISSEENHMLSSNEGHTISSEENHMLSSNEGHTISSEENHMLSSNEGHTISSEENHMLSSNEGHTISSEENHMLSSNEGHMNSSEENHMLSSNEGHMNSSEENHMLSSNEGHMNSSEENHMLSSNEGHMNSSEENHMLSSNEGHMNSSEENHMLSSNEGHMISSEENHMLSSNEGHTISSEENHMLSSNEGHTISSEENHMLSSNEGHTISSEENHMLSSNEGHTISSEENHMLSSNEGHTISSEENHMLSSNEGHTISSEENHMLSSNEGHTISSEENHMLSSNEGHMNSSEENHMLSSNEGHMNSSEENHMLSSNEGHMNSSEENHMLSSNEGHMNSSEENHLLSLEDSCMNTPECDYAISLKDNHVILSDGNKPQNNKNPGCQSADTQEMDFSENSLQGCDRDPSSNLGKIKEPDNCDGSKTTVSKVKQADDICESSLQDSASTDESESILEAYEESYTKSDREMVEIGKERSKIVWLPLSNSPDTDRKESSLELHSEENSASSDGETFRMNPNKQKMPSGTAEDSSNMVSEELNENILEGNAYEISVNVNASGNEEDRDETVTGECEEDGSENGELSQSCDFRVNGLLSDGGLDETSGQISTGVHDVRSDTGVHNVRSDLENNAETTLINKNHRISSMDDQNGTEQSKEDSSQGRDTEETNLSSINYCLLPDLDLGDVSDDLSTSEVKHLKLHLPELNTKVTDCSFSDHCLLPNLDAGDTSDDCSMSEVKDTKLTLPRLNLSAEIYITESSDELPEVMFLKEDKATKPVAGTKIKKEVVISDSGSSSEGNRSYFTKILNSSPLRRSPRIKKDSEMTRKSLCLNNSSRCEDQKQKKSNQTFDTRDNENYNTIVKSESTKTTVSKIPRRRPLRKRKTVERRETYKKSRCVYSDEEIEIFDVDSTSSEDDSRNIKMHCAPQHGTYPGSKVKNSGESSKGKPSENKDGDAVLEPVECSLAEIESDTGSIQDIFDSEEFKDSVQPDCDANWPDNDEDEEESSHEIYDNEGGQSPIKTPVVESDHGILDKHDRQQEDLNKSDGDDKDKEQSSHEIYDNEGGQGTIKTPVVESDHRILDKHDRQQEDLNKSDGDDKEEDFIQNTCGEESDGLEEEMSVPALAPRHVSDQSSQSLSPVIPAVSTVSKQTTVSVSPIKGLPVLFDDSDIEEDIPAPDIDWEALESDNTKSDSVCHDTESDGGSVFCTRDRSSPKPSCSKMGNDNDDNLDPAPFSDEGSVLCAIDRSSPKPSCSKMGSDSDDDLDPAPFLSRNNNSGDDNVVEVSSANKQKTDFTAPFFSLKSNSVSKHRKRKLFDDDEEEIFSSPLKKMKKKQSKLNFTTMKTPTKEFENFDLDMEVSTQCDAVQISNTQFEKSAHRLLADTGKDKEASSKRKRAKELIANLRAKRMRSKSGEGSLQENISLHSGQEMPGETTQRGSLGQRRILPEVQATNDRIDGYLTRCRTLLDTLRQALSQDSGLQGIPRVVQWKKDLQELEQKTHKPRTVIAVVGDTGEGKSSLMNALIDQRNALPTSGMQACTAVVVEIKSNDTRSDFEADIKFLSRQEWNDELQLLLKDLTTADGQIKKGVPDPDTEAGVAYLKVRAVYGKISNFQALSRQTSVTRWLDQTRTLRSSDPDEFHTMIDRYIENKEKIDQSSSGGEFWPIVKMVTIRLPNCDAVSSGAVLVDLPGVRDSNAARDKIAKDYLKECTAVWVVASIHRAVNNKTAKEMLGENFRRQLLMDGQYGSVAFICTKSDFLNSSELIRNLGLKDACEPFKNEMQALRMEKDEAIAIIDKSKQAIRKTNRQVKEIRKEIEETEGDLQEAQSLLQDSDGNIDHDSEGMEELEALKQEIREKEQEIQRMEGEITEQEVQRDEAVRKSLEKEEQIGERRREIACICAEARNKYSTTQIKRDFKAGLKEMKRKSGLNETDDETDDYDDYNSDDDDDEVGSSADNLKVFCVSSTEYQKMKKLLTDGPPMVFKTEEETQIPRLREYIHQMTSLRRTHSAERLIRSLGRFIFDMQGYLMDDGTSCKGTRMDAKSAIEAHARQLHSKLQPVVDKFSNDIQEVLSKSIEPKLKEGVCLASSEATDISAKWGDKPNRENRKEGGLHWMTYRCAVRRQGVYNSKTAGPIDFNEQLSEPMYRCISVSWDKVFSGLLWQQMEICRSLLHVTLRNFAVELCQQLQQLGVPAERVYRVAQQLVLSSADKLTEMVTVLKEIIMSRQRDISRVLVPSVQENMDHTYTNCSCECGQGMFSRMKDIMAEGVNSQKLMMFDLASRKLLTELITLRDDITGHVSAVCLSLCNMLQSSFEPIWEAPNNSRRMRDILNDDIERACSEIKSLFIEANIPLPVALPSAAQSDPEESDTSNPDHPNQVPSPASYVSISASRITPNHAESGTSTISTLTNLPTFTVTSQGLKRETVDSGRRQQTVFREGTGPLTIQLAQIKHEPGIHIPSLATVRIKQEPSAVQVEQEVTGSSRVYNVLQTEKKLVQMNNEIKKCVQKDTTDVDKCLAIMDDLNALPVNQVMLKQNPDIMKTIKMIRKFKGSDKIRKKAEVIYLKFKGFFLQGNNVDIGTSDYYMCSMCYESKGHIHKMEKLGLDLDDGSTPSEKAEHPQESRLQSIQRCIQSIGHASQCRDANCRLPSCQKMKLVVSHVKCCRKKTNGVCPICKKLLALCLYHAKHCQENKCPVPFCLQIKHKLRQQQLPHLLQQTQMLRRRMASVQRGPSTAASTQSTSQPSAAAPVQPSLKEILSSHKKLKEGNKDRVPELPVVQQKAASSTKGVIPLPKEPRNDIQWIVDYHFRQEQEMLKIPFDPRQWNKAHVCHWIKWAIKELGLTRVNPDSFRITGEQLCDLSHSEFIKLVHSDKGGVFWTHLELLRKCQFVCKFVAIKPNPNAVTKVITPGAIVYPSTTHVASTVTGQPSRTGSGVSLMMPISKQINLQPSTGQPIQGAGTSHLVNRMKIIPASQLSDLLTSGRVKPFSPATSVSSLDKLVSNRQEPSRTAARGSEPLTHSDARPDLKNLSPTLNNPSGSVNASAINVAAQSIQQGRMPCQESDNAQMVTQQMQSKRPNQSKDYTAKKNLIENVYQKFVAVAKKTVLSRTCQITKVSTTESVTRPTDNKRITSKPKTKVKDSLRSLVPADRKIGRLKSPFKKTITNDRIQKYMETENINTPEQFVPSSPKRSTVPSNSSPQTSQSQKSRVSRLSLRKNNSPVYGRSSVTVKTEPMDCENAMQKFPKTDMGLIDLTCDSDST